MKRYDFLAIGIILLFFSVLCLAGLDAWDRQSDIDERPVRILRKRLSERAWTVSLNCAYIFPA